MTQTSQTTWQEMLKQLIVVPAERQRIATALNVHPQTLVRWANGESVPRPGALQNLPLAFPIEKRQMLQTLIDQSQTGQPVLPEIPSELLARLLALLATSDGPFVSWTICNLALLQAIHQLDPQQVGMEITIALCVPPAHPRQAVRSLCERFVTGTPPWETGVRRVLTYLGTESLSGFVAGRGEPGVILDMEQEQGLLPFKRGKHERSAAAYPLQRRGRIAGTLLVSSAETDYFSSERLALVEQYANAVALAFPDGAYYAQDTVQLQVMPSFSTQQHLLTTPTFRERVVAARRESGFALTETAAEALIIQRIEHELLMINAS